MLTWTVPLTLEVTSVAAEASWLVLAGHTIPDGCAGWGKVARRVAGHAPVTVCVDATQTDQCVKRAATAPPCSGQRSSPKHPLALYACSASCGCHGKALLLEPQWLVCHMTPASAGRRQRVAACRAWSTRHPRITRIVSAQQPRLCSIMVSVQFNACKLFRLRYGRIAYPARRGAGGCEWILALLRLSQVQ
jgi:hypothetical protein